jgi:hypothetical protein
MKFVLGSCYFWLVMIGVTIPVATYAKGIPSAVSQVEQLLDEFHRSASAADGAKYFSMFAPEGVFIGTDASERWTVAEFKAYADPYFSKGKGWTYKPMKRNVEIASGEHFAWFDEILENASYGTCRGTGVLRKIDGRWKIAQYHLTIPVPNELADALVSMIRQQSKVQKK